MYMNGHCKLQHLPTPYMCLSLLISTITFCQPHQLSAPGFIQKIESFGTAMPLARHLNNAATRITCSTNHKLAQKLMLFIGIFIIA